MDVKFDPAGNAIAAWVGNVGPDGDAVFASERPVGGGWSPPTILAPAAGGFRIRDLALTVDAAGGAVALWDEVTQGVRAASLAAGSGRWQPAVPLTASSVYVVDAAVAADRAGNAVAVWAEGFPDSELRAALRPAASGRWEPATTIASVDYGSQLSVASDEHGGALAVWQELTTDSSVRASELRPGGPVLAQLTAPHAGAAGVPVTFAVTPAAWGSPLVGEPAWDFGDGASARGASVVHTYRRKGTYTVEVTQSDAAGRASRSTATLVVGRATLANRSRPVITGTPRVGATLTCKPGSWTGSQPIRFRYAWMRGGRPIGAGSRHRALTRDAGSLLSCRVTATNGPLTRAATSRPLRIRG
jgi:hypothetical protein